MLVHVLSRGSIVSHSSFSIFKCVVTSYAGLFNAADILAGFILFLSQSALHSSLKVTATVPGSLHLFDLF